MSTQIPVHPQPGIFETTEVSIEDAEGKGFTYTTLDYEVQRNRPKWSVEQAREEAYDRMFDDGWLPVPLPDVEGLAPGMVLAAPGSLSQMQARKPRPVSKKSSSPRLQGGSEAGCYS